MSLIIWLGMVYGPNRHQCNIARFVNSMILICVIVSESDQFQIRRHIYAAHTSPFLGIL